MNETTVMDSTRNTAAASDAVTNFAKALAGHVEGRVALPDWVQTWCWRSVRGSFCRELQTFRRNEKLLVQASQLDWRQVQQAAMMPQSLARSTICFPAVGAFTGETCATGYYTGNIGGSFAATDLVHACMCGATSHADAIRSLARSMICFPAVRAFIGGACTPPMNVGESFAATAFVHVCMCGLVIFGSRYQVSSYYMFLR